MTLILPSVPSREWREPSQAQPKNEVGHQNRAFFRLTARLNDGHIRWRGWFESRDDADVFLYALARAITLGETVPRELWRLPTPAWHPDIGVWPSYDFSSLRFLVSPTGSNQQLTIPSDFNSAANTIEALGAGGSGAHRTASSGHSSATGAGGGEYRLISPFAAASPGVTVVDYQIGAGGGAVNGDHGEAGGGTWFDGTTFVGATLAADGGSRGIYSGGTTAAGGAGGDGGTGITGNEGGPGGSISGNTSSCVATGGGGAGGIFSGGIGGTDRTTNVDFGSAGGQGDTPNGGAGGTGGAAPHDGVDGSGGFEWLHGSLVDGPNYGSGGGGSAGVRTANATNGGAGGAYGGGGGGCVAIGGNSGRGGSGIIVITYTPTATSLKSGFMAVF